MKVLVTGAGGFLGRAMVGALLRRGHRVRAMIRPAASEAHLSWAGDPHVELYRADLRSEPDLGPAFEGIDAAVHAAAAMTADDFACFSGTVTSTERFLVAMAQSPVRRLVLVSSFSVYDWQRIRGELTEESPLEGRGIYQRGGYAMAKLWQERLTRRAAHEHGLQLTVVRPGFIWGTDHVDQACIGQRIGRAYAVFGPTRRVPLTHVENCGDALAACVNHPGAIDQTFNIVDDDLPTAWEYAAIVLRSVGGGWRVPVPHALIRSAVWGIDAISRVVFRGRGSLPSMFVPSRFDARFKPLKFTNRRIRRNLDWQPPLTFSQCVAQSVPLQAF